MTSLFHANEVRGKLVRVCTRVELLVNSYASEQQRSWWSTALASQASRLPHLLRTKEWSSMNWINPDT